MAGESGQSRRSRPVGGLSGDSDPTLTSVDPPMAPITANTPLPPVNPLPLASQPDSEGAVPPSAEQLDLSEQPTALPPPPQNPREHALPPFRRMANTGVSSTWAVYSTFALMFTSLILIVIMAVAAAEISKSVTVLIWIIVLTFVVNIIYAVFVFALAQSSPGQPFRLPFTNSQRGR